MSPCEGFWNFWRGSMSSVTRRRKKTKAHVEALLFWLTVTWKYFLMANFHYESHQTYQLSHRSSPTVTGGFDEPGEHSRASWPTRTKPPARPDDDDGAQGWQAKLWLPAQLHLWWRLGLRVGGVCLGATWPQARTGEQCFYVWNTQTVSAIWWSSWHMRHISGGAGVHYRWNFSSWCCSPWLWEITS